MPLFSLTKVPSLDDRNKMRAPFGGVAPKSGARRGFILTSEIWERETNPPKMLELHAGPAEAQWTLPVRASEEEIQSGHARYFAARRAGANPAYVDTPSVQFQFQSGNILPMKDKEGTTNVIPFGLQDFYAFNSLLNQPALTSTGDHNYVKIHYRSLIYPDMVLFGYFAPEGISWSDSAESPAGFTWSATFKVHESSIDLFNLDSLSTSYEGYQFF